MSRPLVLGLFLLSACASAPQKYYANSGTPNATVTSRSVSGFMTIKSVYLDISEEDGACHANYLGLLEVKKSGDRVALPRDKMVDIEVLFTSESIGGRSGSRASVAYRFKSLAGESYILDIIDNGRSRGFQVYRAGANGKPAGEVAYISRRYCR